MRGISAFFYYGKITTEYKEKGMVDFNFLPGFIFSFLERYKKAIEKAIERLYTISLLPFSVR